MAMGKADESLRSTRLVFYKEDIERIAKTLITFLKNANARCVLLVDKDGHLVTKEGESSTYDMDTISALVAGSFAATKQMAKLLGEEEFSIMFHQGKKDNIQLSLVGDRTLLTVIFDEATTVGMVRLYSAETAKRMGELFEKSDKDIKTKGTPPEDLAQGFAASAKDKLDDLFGG
jgi:predicted regulator of Ras-like GTPase activity (Roadblock/LC7/MglB family)